MIRDEKYRYLIPLNFRTPFIFAPFNLRASNFHAPPKFHFSRPSTLIFAHQIHFAPLLFSCTLNFKICYKFSVFCSLEFFSINLRLFWETNTRINAFLLIIYGPSPSVKVSDRCPFDHSFVPIKIKIFFHV